MEIWFAFIYFIIPSVIFFTSPPLGIVYCIMVLFLKALQLWFAPDLWESGYELSQSLSD